MFMAARFIVLDPHVTWLFEYIVVVPPIVFVPEVPVTIPLAPPPTASVLAAVMARVPVANVVKLATTIALNCVLLLPNVTVPDPRNEISLDECVNTVGSFHVWPA